MAFSLLGGSDLVVVSLSSNSPSKSKSNAPFHRTAYGYSLADWDGLHDHRRDIPRKDVFNLGASAALAKLHEWLKVEIDAYIPLFLIVNIRSSHIHLHGFQLHVLLSWLIRLNQQNKSVFKVKFRQTSIRCKRVIEAANLAYPNETKESITFRKLGSRDFWRIANGVLNKGKFAIPPLF